MDTTLREGIDWVGCIDWNVRDFHSYVTRRGATYNAYLVRDEKTALIDTVKTPFLDDLLRNVARHIALDKVDYVVCNHAEPDHGSGLVHALKAMPSATVVCDAKCRDILSGYMDASGWDFHIVKTGDTLSLGRRTLQFVETPMVHWPDSMFTYVPEEKLLFSMDAFGQHYATMERFDDEVPMDVVMREAKTYYANIVMPYGKQTAKVLEAAGGLELEIVAPSHGIIWRSHFDKILAAYKDWVACKPRAKVLAIYDTMWQSTRMMADAIATGASMPGVIARPIHVRHTTDTETVTEVLDAACIAVGSATLNQTLMPSLAGTLTYIMGLRPAGKCGFAFGSHGWGKGAPEAVNEYLERMKWDVLREPIVSKWRPTHEVLDACEEAGAVLGRKALELAAK